MTSPIDVKNWLEKLNQTSLLTHLEKLPTAKRQKLEAQLQELDWRALKRLLAEKADKTTPVLEPIFEPVKPYASKDSFKSEIAVGEKLIRAGQLAVFLVAGGQGSRLGYEGPKGCFGVTPVRHRPLFEVLAQKILAAQSRYGVILPWVLMTSLQNNSQTQSFFKENNFFGLKENQVHFFIQGVMPAIDAATHQMLLVDDESLLLTPDGTGGSFKGLHRTGTLAWLKERGVKVLSYIQVDNPLVNVVDAAYVGAHVLSKSQFSSKSVLKRPSERVGVLAKKNNNMTIVEYIELPRVLEESKDATGHLTYGEGNIAVHLLNLDFIEKTAQDASLPYARALKKEPYWNGKEKVLPTAPNAIKFEQFVFGALSLAHNPIVLRTLREEEFSPVKNAEGSDSPKTSHDDQLKLWACWLKEAGVIVPLGVDGVPNVEFEITPLFADSLEALKAQKAAGKLPQVITPGIVL